MKSARRARSPKSTTTTTRAPRRCRQCPNSPLKSACGCLKRRRRVVQNTESLNPGLRNLIAAPASSAPVAAASTLQSQGTSAVDSNSGESVRSPPTPDTDQQIPIDPTLIGPQSRVPVRNAAEDSEDDDEEESGQPTKRLTSAEKAELYGLVEGAMRGNMIYRIPRNNALREVLTHASAATTRYNRELPIVISRAERLALETDAYVLVLAQQATGSSATVHFALERLRREAFEDCANLVNQFQGLMTQLVLAKRATTFALARNLEVAERARATAEGMLVDKEAELVASRLANEDLMAELEALKAKLQSNNENPE